VGDVLHVTVGFNAFLLIHTFTLKKKSSINQQEFDSGIGWFMLVSASIVLV